MEVKNKRNQTILAVILMCIVLFAVFAFSDDKDLQKEVVQQATEMAQDIATYEMTEEEIESLPSTEIVEQTEEQENAQEQEVENEDFELQGEIAYEGDRAVTWDVELGDYKGLTYYSQIDRKMVSEKCTAQLITLVKQLELVVVVQQAQVW